MHFIASSVASDNRVRSKAVKPQVAKPKATAPQAAAPLSMSKQKTPEMTQVARTQNQNQIQQHPRTQKLMLPRTATVQPTT